MRACWLWLLVPLALATGCGDRPVKYAGPATAADLQREEGSTLTPDLRLPAPTERPSGDGGSTDPIGPYVAAAQGIRIEDLALVSDGVQPLLAYSQYRMELRAWGSGYRMPVCAVAPDGRLTELRDLVSAVPAPWFNGYARMDLVTRGETDLVVYDVCTPGGVEFRLAVSAPTDRALGLPSALAPETDMSAGGADLCRHGERVHIVGGRHAEPGDPGGPLYESRVWYRSWAWGEWTVWTRRRDIALGSVPAICEVGAGGLAVSLTGVNQPSPRARQSAPRPGPLLLCRSEDGETWTEAKPTVPEQQAHSSAITWEEGVGLVLVYSAERGDNWPLFAARSADLGETWGEPVMLTKPDIRCYRPDALLFEGRLYVAYLEVPPRDPNEGQYHLGDPTGLYTTVLDPTELPLPQTEMN